MKKFIRAYLRASTSEQDAERAKQSLKEFANTHDVAICKFYAENASGTHLERDILNELIQDAHQGDILLIEDIDRLTRLNHENWLMLKQKLSKKRISIVAINLPTTHAQLHTSNQDDFTKRVYEAINGLIIEIVAAAARRDDDTRKARQRQGIKKAKAQGKYKGRQPDTNKYKRILKLVDANMSYKEITATMRTSSATIARAIAWREEQQRAITEKQTLFSDFSD